MEEMEIIVDSLSKDLTNRLLESNLMDTDKVTVLVKTYLLLAIRDIYRSQVSEKVEELLVFQNLLADQKGYIAIERMRQKISAIKTTKAKLNKIQHNADSLNLYYLTRQWMKTKFKLEVGRELDDYLSKQKIK